MTGPRSTAASRAGAVVVALALLSCPALAGDVDPFYERLLEEGIGAYERGDHARAREELRIAAFGLLETPEQLARALAHLALAQSAGGDLEGLERTYRRLTELESQFRAYSAAALGPGVRTALAAAARAHLGGAALEPGAPAVAVAPVPAPGKAEARAPARPAAVKAAASSRTHVCVSWTGDGECGPAAARPAATPAVTPTSPQERTAFERLDRLAAGKATNKQLRSAFEEAVELADRHPEWADMQRVAAILGARSGAFSEAVRYYDRAGASAEEGPIQLFYLSVALFETNQREAAASVLRRALPTLERNREVRRYVRRILSAG